jgi:hypothetical protein
MLGRSIRGHKRLWSAGDRKLPPLPLNHALTIVRRQTKRLTRQAECLKLESLKWESGRIEAHTAPGPNPWLAQRYRFNVRHQARDLYWPNVRNIPRCTTRPDTGPP